MLILNAGGYFNMRKFSEIQTINFAVGYPF